MFLRVHPSALTTNWKEWFKQHQQQCFLRNDHLLNQPLQVLKNLSFHQIETQIYYLSKLSQIVRSWLQFMLLQRLKIVLSQKLQRYILMMDKRFSFCGEYCAPLCDRQCNLKNMKLCYGFATEKAYKETRKLVLGEHARGDTPSTNHSVQNKVSSCCRSISSLWTWKNSWIWKIVEMFVFFLFQQPVSRGVSQRTS